MKIKSLFAYINQLRRVGSGMMANHIALIIPSVAVSTIIVSYLFRLYEIQIAGGWGILWFIIVIFAGIAFVACATTPLWGIYYLRRIKADFGPKTRAKVWNWFDGHKTRSEKTLNIEQFAREVGEFDDGKKNNSLQPSKDALTDELAYDDIMGASRELNVNLQSTVNKYNLTESQFIEALKIATNGVVSSERLYVTNSNTSNFNGEAVERNQKL